MSKKNAEQSLTYAVRQIKDIESDIVKNYKVALDNIRAKLFKLYQADTWTKTEIIKGGQLEALKNEINAELIAINEKNYKLINSARFDAFEQSYNKLFEDAETPTSITKLNKPAITASLENPLYNANFASSMEGLTAKSLTDISNIITQGIISGENIKITANKIKDAINMSAKRAMTIARTETFRANSQGQLKFEEQLQKKGYKTKKYWVYSYVIPDSRPSHVAMDGKEADENGLFNVDGVTMEAPRLSGDPAHDINCRCTYYSEIVNLGATV